MEPPRRSRPPARSEPDEPTRIRDEVPDGPFDVGSAGRSRSTRFPNEETAVAPDGWALGEQAQVRGSAYDSRADEPVFAEDDLAPFSAESPRTQPVYAPPDPEVLELLTSDIDLSDLAGLADQADDPRTMTEESREELRTISSVRAIDDEPSYRPTQAAVSLKLDPQAETAYAVLPETGAQGGRSSRNVVHTRPPELDSAVPALQLSRRPVGRDFDEDLRTRVREAAQRDPSLELSLSEGYVDLRQAPTEEAQLDEKSVVRRIVGSVVAHLPHVFQRAAEKSGIIKLPAGASRIGAGASADFGLPAGAAQALGLDNRAWREARTAPVFDGLPNEALRDALVSRKLQILRIDRDTIIPVGGGLVLVRTGQVALAQFPSDKLEVEREVAEKLLEQNPLIGKKLDKKERKRRQKAGPLIRQAEKNLATFEEGDIVEISVAARRHDTLGIYSVTPVTVLTIDRELAERWRLAYPFMADRLRRAGASARARVEATAGAKAVVADFFIRHGLSVSMTLRVRKLDACIECGACEKACEDRYGAKRLSLNGRILGNLDFVDACHTCTDQRCIDPCNFDAISFDVQRKEVLINEANCTGCTLCAVNCPYDAIEMHELEDKPKLKLRLEKAGALAFGDGTPRKAKLRRMASKCDHCAFYEDQACISACPTGALLEILPSDVVSQMPEQAKATARAGFDRTIRVDINALNQVDHFAKKGLSQLPELGRARARRGRLSINFWWFVGIVALLASCAEIALRKLWPDRSIAYFIWTRAEGLDHEMALSRVDFRPGCTFAVNLGYVGTALMITGLAYVWRRRMPFMRNVGSLRAWFDWHVLSGVIGPCFILLHSVGRLDNWVSLAFWSMVATVLSGLLGRYLTTQLPLAASTATVETLEVDRQIGKLRIEHAGVRVTDGWFEEYRRRLAAFTLRVDGPQQRGSTRSRPATVGGSVVAIFWMLKDDLARGGRSRKLSRLLKASVTGPSARRIRKRAHQLAMRLERLERRRVLLPRLEPLFLRWKAIHVPMAVALTIISSIHIFLALRTG